MAAHFSILAWEIPRTEEPEVHAVARPEYNLVTKPLPPPESLSSAAEITTTL